VIGLDTNVLIRYFTQDDERQAALASDVIDGLTESDPGHVTLIALAEIWWVLRVAYDTDRESVAGIFNGLLDSKEIIVEHAETVRRALQRVGRGADFADSLIHERGVDAGCARTITFDEKAAQRAGMELLA
jgi:predicted nucleic-acid-binding protein